jgi:hypothetical protein
MITNNMIMIIALPTFSWIILQYNNLFVITAFKMVTNDEIEFFDKLVAGISSLIAEVHWSSSLT